MVGDGEQGAGEEASLHQHSSNLNLSPEMDKNCLKSLAAIPRAPPPSVVHIHSIFMGFHLSLSHSLIFVFSLKYLQGRLSLFSSLDLIGFHSKIFSQTILKILNYLEDRGRNLQ